MSDNNLNTDAQFDAASKNDLEIMQKMDLTLLNYQKNFAM